MPEWRDDEGRYLWSPPWDSGYIELSHPPTGAHLGCRCHYCAWVRAREELLRLDERVAQAVRRLEAAEAALGRGVGVGP